MAQALYRKYRSKKLEDLLEQETNVQILKNAAKTGRIGQAYIFYGPRGTGKTSTARLLAKLLNCEKRRTDPEFAKLGEPCNECTACREIDAQNSFDVIEIDAASNRGIDEIRNLKESIRTAPASGGSKVYIIDEAHMLTGAAWNALLKTLEEPPKHAAIVLATTEYEKLPPTITSRAQRFAFKKVSKAAIMGKLAAEAKAEKIKIDEPALELIAAIAEGSVRDAESLLDQIASLGGTITLADVERITGRTGLAKIAEFAAIIMRKIFPPRSRISRRSNGRRRQSGPVHERPHPLSPQSACPEIEPGARKDIRTGTDQRRSGDRKKTGGRRRYRIPRHDSRKHLSAPIPKCAIPRSPQRRLRSRSWKI